MSPGAFIIHSRRFILFAASYNFVFYRIYLDYNATTPLDTEVIQAINNSLTEAWGNPSSSYEAGG